VSKRGTKEAKEAKGTKWDENVLHLDAGLAMTAKKPRPKTSPFTHFPRTQAE